LFSVEPPSGALGSTVLVLVSGKEYGNEVIPLAVLRIWEMAYENT